MGNAGGKAPTCLDAIPCSDPSSQWESPAPASFREGRGAREGKSTHLWPCRALEAQDTLQPRQSLGEKPGMRWQHCLCPLPHRRGRDSTETTRALPNAGERGLELGDVAERDRGWDSKGGAGKGGDTSSSPRNSPGGRQGLAAHCLPSPPGKAKSSLRDGGREQHWGWGAGAAKERPLPALAGL